MNQLIATLSVVAAMGGGLMAAPKAQPVEPFYQGLELPSNLIQPGYNASAAIDVDGWAWDLWGAFTWWNVSQEDMEIGYVSTAASGVRGEGIPGALGAIEGHWSPGFQVGTSFHTGYDSWVVSAEYTWVRSQSSASMINTTGISGYDIYPVMLPYFEPEPQTEVHGKWQVALDQVDATAERPIYRGKALTATSFAGLRGLWIRQRIDYHASLSGAEEFMVVNSRCWGVGPAAGANFHWLLDRHLRLETSAALSLLYTRYTQLSLNYTPSAEFSTHAERPNYSSLRPIAELGIGLGWGRYLGSRYCYVDLSLDYDFKYYWDQNTVIAQLNGIMAEYGNSDLGALMIHGLTVKAGLDF